MRVTFGIFGSWWGGNLGDVAILCGTVETIQEIFPHSKILVPSSNPDRLKRHLPEYDNVHIRGVWTNYLGTKTLSVVREADLVVIGGGGLFFSHSLHNPIKNHLTNIYPLTVLTNFLNVDTHLVSVGVSTLEGMAAQNLTARIINNTSSTSVRDERSKQIIERITGNEIRIAPDMAFALFGPNREFNCSTDLDLPQRYILISLHEHLVLNSRRELDSTASQIIKHIDSYITGKSTEIVFHNNYTTSSWLSDLVDSIDLNSESHIIRGDFEMTPREAIKIYSGAEQAICSQMHANIMSVIGSTPTTAIEYDPKVRSMMKFLGKESQVLTIEQALSQKELIKTVSESSEVADQVIKNITKELDADIRSQFKSILEHEVKI